MIVKGGTSSAIIAAVEVAGSWKSGIIVSPDRYLLGLTAGGLGRPGSGKMETIGRLARVFYHRIWLHYNGSSARKWQKKVGIWKPGSWDSRCRLGKKGHTYFGIACD